MTDDTATLASFQLADSFLPVGGYTASYAVEQFIQTGDVTDADGLRALLTTYLRRQVGPAELVAVRAAHRATGQGDVEALVRADRRLYAATLPAEFRESATRTGSRLCELRRETGAETDLLEAYAGHDPPQQYAAVLGAVAAVEGVDERRVCLLYGYSFCSDVLGAAQRLLSLGHTDTQRVLEELKPVVRTAVADSADRSLDELATFTPLVDIRAAAHERADRRLFVS